MSNDSTWERRLITAADGIALDDLDLGQFQARLRAWLSELTQALSDHRIKVPANLRAAHVLAHQAYELNAVLADSMQAWEHRWEELGPARHLAQAFEDRVMLLVHGKFNAGKSSLCNFLADQFAAHGQPVRFFHLAEGRVVDTAEPLREGAVETTGRLQGVCLGANLVLLDTPGLHSVTPENAALTLRFTDSADAILWLTSSTSPGQVQELDGLARELHRGKPLLPIITRSDVIEEDEIDGELVKLLRNKSPANRSLQEADVRLRGLAKLQQMNVKQGLLKPAVSVSVHVAREQGKTTQDLGDSGFELMYAALLDIVGPAQAYKQHKPAEVVLHHLEENVLGSIKARIQPGLFRLGSMLLQERLRLKDVQPRLVRTVLRQAVPELPQLLERYLAAHDMAGLYDETESILQGALALAVHEALGGYGVRLVAEQGCLQTWPADQPSYECLYDLLVERTQKSITQQVEDAIGQCRRELDLLEGQVRALQDVLAGPHDRLMQIKRYLRDEDAHAASIDSLGQR